MKTRCCIGRYSTGGWTSFDTESNKPRSPLYGGDWELLTRSICHSLPQHCLNPTQANSRFPSNPPRLLVGSARKGVRQSAHPAPYLAPCPTRLRNTRRRSYADDPAMRPTLDHPHQEYLVDLQPWPRSARYPHRATSRRASQSLRYHSYLSSGTLLTECGLLSRIFLTEPVDLP